MLFRLHYRRDGKPQSLTFWADDLVEAERFRSLWERMAKVSVPHWEQVGQSRFVERRGRVELRKTPPIC